MNSRGTDLASVAPWLRRAVEESPTLTHSNLAAKIGVPTPMVITVRELLKEEESKKK